MNFRTRLKAALIHFLITIVVTAAVAGLIFGIWFPGAFSDMVGGKQLFLLVLGCDIVLGPMISLVIYNRKKSRAELVRDYMIIGTLQLAALLYGVVVVAGSRPAYIVFVKDRFVVVTAQELEDADLAQATDERYQKRGWVGPQLVGTEQPENAKERQEVMFSALEGKDIQRMPKYYRPFDTAIAQIRQRSLSIVDLITYKPESKAIIESAVQKLGGKETLRWLPVQHRFGFWIALIDIESGGEPLKYLPIDPYVR